MKPPHVNFVLNIPCNALDSGICICILMMILDCFGIKYLCSFIMLQCLTKHAGLGRSKLLLTMLREDFGKH